MASRFSISSYQPPLTDLAFVHPTHHSAISSLFSSPSASRLTDQEIAAISESFSRFLKPKPNFRSPQTYFPIFDFEETSNPHPLIPFAKAGSSEGMSLESNFVLGSSGVGSTVMTVQNYKFLSVKDLLKEVCPSVKVTMEFFKVDGVLVVRNGDHYPSGILSDPIFIISPVETRLGLPPLRFSQEVHFFGGIPKIYTLVMVDVGITNSYLYYLEINRGTDNTSIVCPFIAPEARSAGPVRWMALLVFEQERHILPHHVCSISSCMFKRRVRSTFSLTNFQRTYNLTVVGHSSFFYQ